MPTPLETPPSLRSITNASDPLNVRELLHPQLGLPAPSSTPSAERWSGSGKGQRTLIINPSPTTEAPRSAFRARGKPLSRISQELAVSEQSMRDWIKQTDDEAQCDDGLHDADGGRREMSGRCSRSR
jgi:hypothetical protein